MDSGSLARWDEELRARGGYRTPEGEGRRPAAGSLPTLRFHAGMVMTYWRASRLAVRGEYDLRAWAHSSLAVLRLVERCGGRIRIEDLRNAGAAGGAAVYVANHMSTLETSLLPCILLPFGSVAFIVKESLCRYPVAGPVIRAVPHIAVNRKNARDDLRQVLTEGSRMLKEGISIVVFPQSTRSPGLDLGRFNSLGIKLAAHAGAPVVPLALKTDFLQNGAVCKDFGRVDPGREIRFRFGAPLRAAGNGRGEHEQVLRFLTDTLPSWGVPVLPRGGDA